MKKIYKYKLVWGLNILSMPLGAEILTAKEQNKELQLWALVDITPEFKVEEDRNIEVFWTGQEIKDENVDLEYISSIQASNGLVYHVFESTKVTIPHF